MGTGQIFSFLNRRTQRAPQNPMDKSTIVSIFPKDIFEKKVTLQPGAFYVPSGTPDHPGVLTIGSSSWWKELEEGQPLLEIPQHSLMVAQSVVVDYCNGMVGCNMADAMPGLFCVEGEYSSVDIVIKFPEKLKAAEAKQNNWYRVLIDMADSDWSKSNGNPRVINEFARIGAKHLGLEDKGWLKNYQAVQLVRCEACGNLRDPEYPICPSCKVIDPKHPKAKDLKFAV